MQVRYFAGAAEAAGTTSEDLAAGDLTGDQLVDRLGADRADLAAVLAVSTLLVDGRPLADRGGIVPAGSQVDVLPPFAGG